jgi:hypothetical protein
MYLETNKLERQINLGLLLIKKNVDEDLWSDLAYNVYFERHLTGAPEGTYIYTDSLGYHLEYYDYSKGIFESLFTLDIYELCFRIYWIYISLITIRKATVDMMQCNDWIKIMLQNRIELLKLLGDPYVQKGMKCIDKILEVST